MTKVACAVDKIASLKPDEIKAILDQDKEGEFLLIDVRQPEEYEAGHIPGSVLIPLGELEARHRELNRSKKIITYCRSGRRSMAAAIALCGLGFESVYNMSSGILDWHYGIVSGIPETKPELVTEAARIRDILVLGIKLEKGSWDFYMEAVDKFEQPQVKDTFQRLANAEDGHMQKLYQRALGLLPHSSLPPLDKLKQELKAVHMEGGIEISLALATTDNKFADEMDALEIALEKEYMSYDFYKQTSALVKDPDARALLHELALEERHHADILLKRVAEIVR